MDWWMNGWICQSVSGCTSVWMVLSCSVVVETLNNLETWKSTATVQVSVTAAALGLHVEKKKADLSC